MAYNFGQFLSSKLNGYLINIPEGTGGGYQIKPYNRQVGERTYPDKEIEYQMGTIETNPYYYYLKYKIKRKQKDVSKNISGDQKITIRLAHGNSTNNNRQTLQTILVPEAKTLAEEVYVTFDLIIAPNDNYNEIQLILDRKADADYDTREIDLQVVQYAKIVNVISSLGNSISKLKQVGIQGSPELQMCIDGESIKIGRTGIYEINHGYEISFLGFIYDKTDPNEKPFILDYQY